METTKDFKDIVNEGLNPEWNGTFVFVQKTECSIVDHVMDPNIYKEFMKRWQQST